MNLNYAKQFDAYIRQIARDEMQLQLSTQLIQKSSNTQKLYSTNIIRTPQTALFGWRRDKRILPELHDLIYNSAFITCGVDDFINHFYGSSENLKPITWFSQINMLALLTNLLMGSTFINDVNDIHVLTANHFIDKEGKKISAGNLRSSLSKISHDSKGFKIIDDIIKKLIKISNR